MAHVIDIEMTADPHPPVTTDQTDLETVCWARSLAEAAGRDEWVDSYDQLVEMLLEAHRADAAVG